MTLFGLGKKIFLSDSSILGFGGLGRNALCRNRSCFWTQGYGKLGRNRRRLLTGSSVEPGCWGLGGRNPRGRRNGLITNRNRRPRKRKTSFLDSTRLGMRFRTPAGSLGAGRIGALHRIH